MNGTGWWRGLLAGIRLPGAALLGVLVGMGIYVARISEGASYLSDDPRACINCHVMIPQYATWLHSSHARVAHCNDCHVPHTNVFAHYGFKASDGLRHSALFTLRQEEQVIQAIPKSRRVIQGNCVRCHEQMFLLTGFEAGHGDGERHCVDCHREVPHGRVHSLTATPNAAVPPLAPATPGWMRP